MICAVTASVSTSTIVRGSRPPCPAIGGVILNSPTPTAQCCIDADTRWMSPTRRHDGGSRSTGCSTKATCGSTAHTSATRRATSFHTRMTSPRCRASALTTWWRSKSPAVLSAATEVGAISPASSSTGTASIASGTRVVYGGRSMCSIPAPSASIVTGRCAVTPTSAERMCCCRQARQRRVTHGGVAYVGRRNRRQRR